MPDPQPATVQQEPVEAQDEWLEQPEELPRRPRRRLLGAGGNPLALALLGVLLTACGFIGGVLVEKGETSTSSASASSASSLASRFRSLRAGLGAGASSGAGTGTASSGGAFAPTSGTVAYLAGSTLYVTNAEGNTVKVKTSATTSVSKTVSASVKGIHPGETVTITGATGANGTISAESIRVGSGGGLAALFGAGGTGRSQAGGASGGGSSEPSLFGGG